MSKILVGDVVKVWDRYEERHYYGLVRQSTIDRLGNPRIFAQWTVRPGWVRKLKKSPQYWYFNADTLWDFVEKIERPSRCGVTRLFKKWGV